MPGVERFEILILGGGKAGKTLAMDMARAGRGVALIERGMIGGSCINVACIPTKALVRSAEVAHLARHAAAFGTVVDAARTDMPRVAARTASVVEGLVDMHRDLFAASGFDLLVGEGRFVEPRVIEVALADGGKRTVTGDRIFLNLGTVAAIPQTPGLRDTGPLTHVEALLLERAPSHLLVLGGGYVGLEMAQAFRRLGSGVTVIQRGPRLIPREDQDVADAVQSLLGDEGVEIILEADLRRASGRSGRSVQLQLTINGDERVLEGTDLLVATGRVPQTAGIGLDIAGVELDSRGFIKVDERLHTTAEKIWALGEVAGSPMFTHVAMDDYRIARSCLLGGDRTTNGRLIPYCVFIDPELARIGLSEADASRQGVAVRTANIPRAKVPRARTLGQTSGFMKALVDPATDKILGFAMLGTHAGEIVAVIQAAMLGGLPYTALRDGIITHPTIAEGLNVLFSEIPPPDADHC